MALVSVACLSNNAYKNLLTASSSGCSIRWSQGFCADFPSDVSITRETHLYLKTLWPPRSRPLSLRPMEPVCICDGSVGPSPCLTIVIANNSKVEKVWAGALTENSKAEVETYFGISPDGK